MARRAYTASLNVRVALIAALAILTLLLASCGGAPAGGQPGGTPAGATKGVSEIRVVMSEFKFEPSTITVPQGQRVVVTLQNRGQVQHDFAVQEFNVLSPDVAPGQTGRVEFTPPRTGTFRIVCTEPGHAEAGMVGQLVVQPA